MRAKYLVGFLVVLGAIGYLVWGGLGKNLVYFITPSEYMQNPGKYTGKLIRLGGLVEAGTVQYNPKTMQLRFVMTDGITKVPVHYEGAVPDMFGANRGVVVQGKFGGRTFEGDELLVKHNANYTPPPKGDTSEAVRKIIEETR